MHNQKAKVHLLAEPEKMITGDIEQQEGLNKMPKDAKFFSVIKSGRVGLI